MRARIIRAYSHSPLRWPNADGVNQLTAWSRLATESVPMHDADGDLIPTSEEMIEATPAVINEIAASADILYVEEIVEDGP